MDERLRRLAAYCIVKDAARDAAERRSREWDAKQVEWVERQEENLQRWDDQHHANLERIEKLAANLERLTERLKHTRNKAKAEEIEGWILEASQKKARLEGFNADLVDKARDVRRKLAEGNTPPPYYTNPSGRKPTYHTGMFGPAIGQDWAMPGISINVGFNLYPTRRK